MQHVHRSSVIVIWQDDLHYSNIYFILVAFCVYTATDCGHPLLLYTGAVFLPVLTLFPIHRHQEEGKNDCKVTPRHISRISNNMDHWMANKKNDTFNHVFLLKPETSAQLMPLLVVLSQKKKIWLSLSDCPSLFLLSPRLYNFQSICSWTFAFCLSVFSLMCEITKHCESKKKD